MSNSHSSANGMSLDENSRSVSESGSNSDYGEVRLAAWEPYRDESLARPRAPRENRDEEEHNPDRLSIITLESGYEKTIFAAEDPFEPLAQASLKDIITEITSFEDDPENTDTEV